MSRYASCSLLSPVFSTTSWHPKTDALGLGRGCQEVRVSMRSSRSQNPRVLTFVTQCSCVSDIPYSLQGSRWLIFRPDVVATMVVNPASNSRFLAAAHGHYLLILSIDDYPYHGCRFLSPIFSLSAVPPMHSIRSCAA